MEITSNLILILVILAYNTRLVYSTLNEFANKYFKIGLIGFCFLHFSISLFFAYFLYDMSFINDPKDFYRIAAQSDDWFGLFGLGHQFMFFVTYPFVKLKIHITVLFLLYASISFKAFLSLFSMLKLDSIKNSNAVLFLFFFIPSLHFWSGFLGKEALLLWLMVTILQNINRRRYDWRILVSLLFVFLIRPHVFIVLIGAMIIVAMLSDEFSQKYKTIIFLLTFLAIAISIVIFILYYLKLDNFNVQSILDYKNRFLNFSKTDGGSSAISIENTTIFTRIFYLVFMPLPLLYQFTNNFQVLLSIENIFFVVGVIVVLFFWIRRPFKYKDLSIETQFALVASFLLIVLFGSYLYNLGLGNRMRVMFLPFLFYFFIKTSNFNKSLN
jgi:hypothetical protein